MSKTWEEESWLENARANFEEALVEGEYDIAEAIIQDVSEGGYSQNVVQDIKRELAASQKDYE